jgi:hypothetical protein
MITIYESANPDRFTSQHFVHFPMGDNKAVLILTGIALIQIEATNAADWYRDTLELHLLYPPSLRQVDSDGRERGLRPEHWSVFISPTAFAHDSNADQAGWAVDNFGMSEIWAFTERIPVQVGIAVRGAKAHLLRLAYNVTIYGQYEWVPPRA